MCAMNGIPACVIASIFSTWLTPPSSFTACLLSEALYLIHQSVRAAHAPFLFDQAGRNHPESRRAVGARIFANLFADAVTAILRCLLPCLHNREDQCRSCGRRCAHDGAGGRAVPRFLSGFSKAPADQLRNRIPGPHSKIFPRPVRNQPDWSRKSARTESVAGRRQDRQLPFAPRANWRGDHRDSIQAQRRSSSPLAAVCEPTKTLERLCQTPWRFTEMPHSFIVPIHLACCNDLPVCR